MVIHTRTRLNLLHHLPQGSRKNDKAWTSSIMRAGANCLGAQREQLFAQVVKSWRACRPIAPHLSCVASNASRGVVVVCSELVHFVGRGPADRVGPGWILCQEVPKGRGLHPAAVNHVPVDRNV